MTKTEINHEIEDRKARGLALRFPFHFFGARGRAKELGALWDPEDKVWCFPDEDSLQDVSARCGDEAERVGEPQGQQTLPVDVGQALREEVQRHDETRFSLEQLKKTLAAEKADHRMVKGDRDGLQARCDSLQGEVNALRDEVKSLKNAAPLDVSVGVLKQQAIEGLAREASEGVRKAVLAILKSETRAPEAPGALDAAPATRRLDLDEAPRIAKPTGDSSDAALTLAEGDEKLLAEGDPDADVPEGATHVTGTCRKCGKFGLVLTHVRLHEECVEKAPASPAAASDPAKRAPEAPAPSSPARGLQKCEKCGRLLLGKAHRCKK